MLCQGHRKDGSRCQARASKNADFCWRHLDVVSSKPEQGEPVKSEDLSLSRDKVLGGAEPEARVRKGFPLPLRLLPRLGQEIAPDNACQALGLVQGVPRRLKSGRIQLGPFVFAPDMEGSEQLKSCLQNQEPCKVSFWPDALGMPLTIRSVTRHLYDFLEHPLMLLRGFVQGVSPEGVIIEIPIHKGSEPKDSLRLRLPLKDPEIFLQKGYRYDFVGQWEEGWRIYLRRSAPPGKKLGMSTQKPDQLARYLLRQVRKKSPIVVGTYAGVSEGTIKWFDAERLAFQGEEKVLAWSNVLYIVKPDTVGQVESLAQEDAWVVEDALGPAESADILEIPLHFLEQAQKLKKRVLATLRNGQTHSGFIHSAGPRCIRLEIAENSRVLLLNSALYDLEWHKESAATH